MQSMTLRWHDITYLSTGTPTQRRAFASLSSLGILTTLAPFNATLASTVCTDIDIEGSDLDIICYITEPDLFRAALLQNFGTLPGFDLSESSDPLRIVATFMFDGFEIEVFAEAIPVAQQNAYRHMCQTARVIEAGGPHIREAIRDLKRRGMKTEPAVAHLLALDGDPYEAVLNLDQIADTALDALVIRALSYKNR